MLGREMSEAGVIRENTALVVISLHLRRVQQCEHSPRARYTGTYLYSLCVKPATSI